MSLPHRFLRRSKTIAFHSSLHLCEGTEFYDGSYNPISSTVVGNPYLFTGRRYDPESGNYYYRARIYSPALGRFLSTDPMGYAAGDANLYRYTFNNPTNFTDPSGQIFDTVLDIGFIIYDVYVLTDHLITGCGNIGEDLLALGLDVGGALVPFVTGGGLAVRAAAKADNIGDVTQLLNKADDIGAGARQVFDPDKLKRISLPYN
ncbi:MAG: RHS repeat-associated core domain-containing protein [Chloroflexi bacterium]|nr:RHS repeat-associated core domain-containing protein [Chloroflexota bacterium]